MAFLPAPPVRIVGEEVHKELGRDHRAVALAFALLEKVTDDLFGVSRGVGVGRIDEVPTLSQVVRKDRFGVLHTRPKTMAHVLSEGHGSKAEGTHAQTGSAKCQVRVQWHGYITP